KPRRTVFPGNTKLAISLIGNFCAVDVERWSNKRLPFRSGKVLSSRNEQHFSGRILNFGRRYRLNIFGFVRGRRITKEENSRNSGNNEKQSSRCDPYFR